MNHTDARRPPAGTVFSIASPRRKETGKKLRRFSRYWYLRLVRLQASPRKIAAGFAAGVFIGLLPVMPFQTVLALVLAFAVRGSKIAALLGNWVSNPLTWAPSYILYYHIGGALAPFTVPPLDLDSLKMSQMLELGWEFFMAMLLGGLVVAAPAAAASYFGALKAVAVYRSRRKARLNNARRPD